MFIRYGEIGFGFNYDNFGIMFGYLGIFMEFWFIGGVLNCLDVYLVDFFGIELVDF